jgi:hypothetical protein
MRQIIEAKNPGIVFDWEALAATPMPSVEPEPWRERRRAERAAKLARRREEAPSLPTVPEDWADREPHASDNTEINPAPGAANEAVSNQPGSDAWMSGGPGTDGTASNGPVSNEVVPIGDVSNDAAPGTVAKKRRRRGGRRRRSDRGGTVAGDVEADAQTGAQSVDEAAHPSKSSDSSSEAEEQE